MTQKRERDNPEVVKSGKDTMRNPNTRPQPAASAEEAPRVDTFGAPKDLPNRLGLLALVTFLLVGSPAVAQWQKQTFTLVPGFNAVFIAVEPSPKRCDDVFRDLPVERVWCWNERTSNAQFVGTGERLLPPPRWLLYVPPSSPDRPVMNLFTLRGGRPYVIKLSGDEEKTLHVPGRPVPSALRWESRAFTLAGFPSDPTAPPTFQDFFKHSPVHQDQPVYRVDPSRGMVAAEPGDPMRAGEAVFVFSSKPSTYQGPIGVDVGGAGILDFGSAVVERKIRVRNLTSASKTVVIDPLPSLEPPTDEEVLAGPVPLSYFAGTGNPITNDWIAFTEPLDLTIPANEELELRFAVRRRDMAPFDPPPGTSAAYQRVLKITDGEGFRTFVPVRARQREAPPALAGHPGNGGGAGADVNVNAGLWVGTVRVDAVSQPASADPETPLPTDSRFQFRILVHVDHSGNMALLRDVILLRREATETEPARFILCTHDSCLAECSGSALRDGRLVGRRFSTPILGIDTPCVGSPGSNQEVIFTVKMEHDHRLNPFFHRYHPDHDSLDARFENALGAGVESFEITRVIKLEFEHDEDPEYLGLPGFGDSHFGGTYRETLRGVHKNAVEVKGIFRLHRAVSVAYLNDGNNEGR